MFQSDLADLEPSAGAFRAVERVLGVLDGKLHVEAGLAVRCRRVGARRQPLRVALDDGPEHVAEHLLHDGRPEARLLGEDVRLGDDLHEGHDADVSRDLEEAGFRDVGAHVDHRASHDSAQVRRDLRRGCWGPSCDEDEFARLGHGRCTKDGSLDTTSASSFESSRRDFTTILTGNELCPCFGDLLGNGYRRVRVDGRTVDVHLPTHVPRRHDVVSNLLKNRVIADLEKLSVVIVNIRNATATYA